MSAAIGWLCDRHHVWQTFASGCWECDDERDHFSHPRGAEVRE